MGNLVEKRPRPDSLSMNSGTSASMHFQNGKYGPGPWVTDPFAGLRMRPFQRLYFAG